MEKVSNKEIKDLSFENAIKELEGIVSKLEEGEVSLEKSLELYQRGVKLIEYCNKKLTEAEGIISILYNDDDGNLKETVFEAE